MNLQLEGRSTVLLLLTALTVSCASTGSGETLRFDVVNRYRIDVPEGADRVEAWLAVPDPGDELQDVHDLDVRIDAPPGGAVDSRRIRDRLGNEFLHLTGTGAGGTTIGVDVSFELVRRESVGVVDPAATRPLTEAERRAMAGALSDSTNVVATPAIRKAAASAVGDERNPIRQARLLYDWVLDHVQYWVKDPTRWKSSGVGSSVYTFEQCTGNCTDFHSLYAAAARAVGLPTRMVYGSFFKGPLDGLDRDQSYHCWIEFWAPDVGWVPLDVAVADVFVDDFEPTAESRSGVELTVADGYAGPDPALVEYYFGNLDARRVTWHRGRDLVLDPAPRAGPLNALPKAHVEIDGRVVAEKAGWTRTLTFREL